MTSHQAPDMSDPNSLNSATLNLHNSLKRQASVTCCSCTAASHTPCPSREASEADTRMDGWRAREANIKNKVTHSAQFAEGDRIELPPPHTNEKADMCTASIIKTSERRHRTVKVKRQIMTSSCLLGRGVTPTLPTMLCSDTTIGHASDEALAVHRRNASQARRPLSCQRTYMGRQAPPDSFLADNADS